MSEIAVGIVLGSACLLAALCACAPLSSGGGAEAGGEGHSIVSLAVLQAQDASDGVSGSGGSGDDSVSRSASSTSSSAAGDMSPSSGIASEAKAPVAYPTAWLAIESGGVPAGTPVSVLALPDEAGVDAVPHRGGKPVSARERDLIARGWPSVGEGQALVMREGNLVVVNADTLLVNLPDFVPGAVYDVVYSYASTSRCAGQDIPDVTGQRLPGYPDGKQPSSYWEAASFAVPCAYRTALKLQQVERALEKQDLRLLVYDAYRPMTAQLFLSDAFSRAFAADPVMQESLGAWSLDWYVASGASGHNYGTDVDVGACDAVGKPLPMPSAFDAFDESGHLTDAPMARSDIAPGTYRAEVSENDACVALHQAFVDAGFSELASEWWHFGDDETQRALQELVGLEGLDFTAVMPT